ncbi:MAG: HupE/UreJ family protein, partial [Gemmatimonadaceae bacterium]|nr:HupE/UreJ family protein [Acetobacteraceae bacterium]
MERAGVIRWVLAGVLAPTAASAHLVQSGLGPFYDGLLHPLVSLEDLLPLLALGVLAGLRGAGHARWLLLVVPLGWLGGFALNGVVTLGPGVLLAIAAFGVAL